VGSKLILLVEDNSSDEELAVRALRRGAPSHEIVVARSGVEALDYLFAEGVYKGRDSGRRPDLVLLDLKLPKVDGLGVLERIRADERTRLIPVVILTSSAQQDDVIRAYRLGCNSYLHKPIDFSRFVEMAHTVVSYWLEMNVVPGEGGRPA
jgi:CheY-like chemotaxis protein